MDRIIKLLDRHPDKSAVIAASLDWAVAFDRQKFIELGLRPSLIPLLISYLGLIGGGPQGTLIGQLEYLVLSNNNADTVSADDRYKYIDDLTVLQLVCLSGLLTEYNFTEHVASDIGVGQTYLPADSYPIQDHIKLI